MSRRIDDLLSGMIDIERRSYERLWAQAEEAGSILAQIDPQKRRRLYNHARNAMLLRQGRRCAEPTCRKILEPDNIHKDHIIPISYGGGNETSNLRLLCSRCNLSRGNDLYGCVEIEAFIKYIEDRLRNLPTAERLAYFSGA